MSSAENFTRGAHKCKNILLFVENSFVVLWEKTSKAPIYMKCQALFSAKNRKENFSNPLSANFVISILKFKAEDFDFFHTIINNLTNSYWQSYQMLFHAI